MSHRLLTCSYCRAPLPAWHLQTTNLEACPRCGTQQWVTAFPAALRDAAPPNLGQPLRSEEESSCYYHADKEAEVPCDSCGRFLCGLCTISFRGRQLCPSCIDTGLKTEQFGPTRSHYPAYDTIAMLLVILPMIIFPIVVFTAPIALYYGVRALRGPRVPARSTTLRAAIAMGLATVQLAFVILFWGSLIVSLVGGRT
jgi:uncharacterized paraquat-inducible protein A